MNSAEFLVSRYGFYKAWNIIADACAEASLREQQKSVLVWLALLEAIELLDPKKADEFPNFAAEPENLWSWPPAPEFRLM